MREPTSFRPAIPSDAETVLGLQRAYCREDGYPFAEAEARPAVDRRMGDPSLGRVWVAEAEGSVGAYAVLTFG